MVSLVIFKAAELVGKIGISLKPNHHNQVKIVKIHDMKGAE